MDHEIHTEPGTTRLFTNPVLEIFSRTHPAFVPSIYVPVAALLLWYSLTRTSIDVLSTIGLATAGIFTWTFVEYWLHRTIMHWIPNDTWGERMHFWVHGIHHIWPNDPLRLVMPPVVSITLFFIFLGLYRWLLGAYAWAFMAGFTLGYVAYDLMHFVLHHAKFRWEWFKKLQHNHLSHHFSEKYENLRFGVSTSLWDHVFGTYRVQKSRKRETSAT